MYKRHFLQLIFYIQFCKYFNVSNLFSRLLDAKSAPIGVNSVGYDGNNDGRLLFSSFLVYPPRVG